MAGPLALIWVARYVYKQTWGRARAEKRAEKRASKAQQRAIEAERRAPSLVRPPDPVSTALVSTHNGLPSYSEAVDSPNESWDAPLIQTLVQGLPSMSRSRTLTNENPDNKGGWRVPQPDEQPGNPDVWTILRRTHRTPRENVIKRMLKKMGKKSKDAKIRVSDEEAPYKSKNPYLPRNVYEHPPRAHIRTPSGLFVSTAQIWEIQYRTYVFGRQHKFEGLEMHIAELEKRFREQRLIT